MNGLIQFVYVLIQVLGWAIFARVILSWFMISTRNRTLISVYQVLAQLTEPILAPLRRVIPMVGMFDITPIVAFFLLQAISIILLRLTE